MLGLWPATPTRPNLAFTLELMNTIHFLVRECQTSLHDVANVLRCIGRQQSQVCPHQYEIVILNNGGVLQDKDIYKLLTNTFPQYR